MRLFWRKRKQTVATVSVTTSWDLLTPLFNWGNRDDRFTIGQSVEGLLILGGTGSGKTSGSGESVAMAYLSAGYGGLVLTVKRDETAVTAARAAGRPISVFSLQRAANGSTFSTGRLVGRVKGPGSAKILSPSCVKPPSL